MTTKQSNMIAERLRDTTSPNSDIIKRAGYKVSSNHTASQIYLENMKKPEIRSRLEPVIDEVEEVLIENIREFKGSGKQWERELANDNAKWIHDKVRGKATQQLDVRTTAVTVSIDLTGMNTPDESNT